MKFIRIKNIHFLKQPDERLKSLGVEQDESEILIGDVVYPFHWDMIHLETAFDKTENALKNSCNLIYGDIVVCIAMNMDNVINMLNKFEESEDLILELINKQ